MNALRSTGQAAWIAVAFLLLLAAGRADAVPSFARQTGLDCTACHVSWPELTSVGRQFKLGGYTLIKPVTSGERPVVSVDADGNPPWVPLAAFVQASVTRTANTDTPGTDTSSFPKNKSLYLQQASLFLAGRIAENAGGFIQYSYDGLAHHGSIDNVDLRVTNRLDTGSLSLQYGLSLNNNPTVSDVFNSTPVWGFPFASSSVAAAPAASALIQEGLGQQVVGLTAYTLWNRTVYAEIGGYRTADKAWSAFRAGVDRSEAAVLDGTAPYWRLALQHDWDEGTQSAMVGAYGLTAKKFPDPSQPVGPSDRFRDVAIDAQYQYVTDLHRFSGQFTRIRETQNLDATFAAGGSENPSNKLTVFAGKLTYYYQRAYGVSFGYQRTTGDADAGLYDTGDPVNGSINGSPDSSAVIVELNWLPWRNRRITLQYTAYQKFNGARTNYDGFGRNARDNNSIYLLAWLLF